MCPPSNNGCHVGHALILVCAATSWTRGMLRKLIVYFTLSVVKIQLSRLFFNLKPGYTEFNVNKIPALEFTQNIKQNTHFTAGYLMLCQALVVLYVTMFFW